MRTFLFLPVALLLFCIGIAIPVWIGVYVYKDAKKRNMDAVLWTIVTVLLPSLIGLIIYIIVRPNMNWKCPTCQNVIRDDFSVCPYCEQTLKAKCKNCQTPIRRDWSHCPTCGKEITPEELQQIPMPIPVKRDKTLTAVLVGVIIVPLVLFLIVIIAFFSFQTIRSSKAETSYIEEIEHDDIAVDRYRDDLFEMVLYMDKKQYTANEAIRCYATLKYIGKDDSITIYHSDPLIGFALKDNQYFHGELASDSVLRTTTMKKGEILFFDYQKAGGWSDEDVNASFYQKFYAQPELILPAGKYELTAAISCSFDKEDLQNAMYHASTKTNFSVLEE